MSRAFQVTVINFAPITDPLSFATYFSE